MLTKLYYFLTVAKTGNLTRAAEDLFISQPALTMSIKRLEKELGVEIVGNTMIKVSVEEEEDDYDIIEDVPSEEVDEVMNEIDEDYLK